MPEQRTEFESWLGEHMLDFGMNNRAKAMQLSCGQTTQATKLVPSVTNLSVTNRGR